MQRPPSEERGPLHGQSRQGRAEDRSAMPSVCSGRPKIAVQSRALAVRLPVRLEKAHRDPHVSEDFGPVRPCASFQGLQAPL